tara:strand:- start:632 stop:826 length:195 start_codon:yes stop_codon:yes gene_type:complete
MGSMFKSPKPMGPSEAELAAMRRTQEAEAERKRKEEEETAQRKLNRRGRRSLLSEENPGSGYLS